jgi:hypothetical protein
MFLVYELARDIAIAKQQVIVDISQKMYLLIQHHLFLWYHLAIKSPLLPEAFLSLLVNTLAGANMLSQGVIPGFHSV